MSPQFNQLFNRQPRLIQDLAQSSRPDSLMIRNDHACVRIRSSEYDVATLLPVHDETDAAEDLDQLLARQITREFHSRVSV